jgi:hypothetical protein
MAAGCPEMLEFGRLRNNLDDQIFIIEKQPDDRAANEPGPKMRKEDQILFLSARRDFEQQHRQSVVELIEQDNIDWELLLSTAVEHGVAPLVYENLIHGDPLGIKLPADIAQRFKLVAVHNAIDKEKRAKKLAVALDYLNQHSLEAMLIKGAALDLFVYQRPYLTTSKDIDIILSRRRDEFSVDEMHALGTFMHGSGIEYDFYEHHDTNINGALPVDFDWIWRDAARIDFRGQPARVMCPEDMLISVCINSCRKRFFRLKSLMDIAETVKKLPDLDWQKLVVKARAYDCHPIVYTSLSLARRTLGCSLPEETLKSLGVGALRVRMIDWTVRFLLRETSLSTYPFSGLNLFGRQVNLALILPYMNYRSYQIWRKMGEIKDAWQTNA